MEAGKWLAYSIVTLLLWGAWGVLLKLASEGRSWKEVYVSTNLAIVAAVLILLALEGPGVVMRGRQLAYALAAGAFGTLGFVALVLALESGGKASIVIPLTSAYPGVTVILARIMLGEHLETIKILGVVLIIVGIVLVSLEGG